MFKRPSVQETFQPVKHTSLTNYYYYYYYLVHMTSVVLKHTKEFADLPKS